MHSDFPFLIYTAKKFHTCTSICFHTIIRKLLLLHLSIIPSNKDMVGRNIMEFNYHTLHKNAGQSHVISADCLSVYGSADLVNLGHFLSFLNLYTVGRAPWMGDQPVAMPLPTHRINAHIGIRTTIPVFQRAKTVHAFDRAATVIGEFSRLHWENLCPR
jgi:hypothetical protein